MMFFSVPLHPSMLNRWLKAEDQNTYVDIKQKQRALIVCCLSSRFSYPPAEI